MCYAKSPLQDEGLRLLHSKAEIIDELEATLPQWLRSRTWYPAFVHILKIHPDATYEVRTLGTRRRVLEDGPTAPLQCLSM